MRNLPDEDKFAIAGFVLFGLMIVALAIELFVLFSSYWLRR